MIYETQRQLGMAGIVVFAASLLWIALRWGPSPEEAAGDEGGEVAVKTTGEPTPKQPHAEHRPGRPRRANPQWARWSSTPSCCNPPEAKEPELKAGDTDGDTKDDEGREGREEDQRPEARPATRTASSASRPQDKVKSARARRQAGRDAALPERGAGLLEEQGRVGQAQDLRLQGAREVEGLRSRAADRPTRTSLSGSSPASGARPGDAQVRAPVIAPGSRKARTRARRSLREVDARGGVGP